MNRSTEREFNELETSHLTPEQLNALVDRRFDDFDEATLQAHLVDCERCAAELRSLEATVSLYRALPLARPARSFQLTPEMAEKRSFWAGLAAKLIPAVPALRTATVAIAILLIVVGAGDIFRNGGDKNNNVFVAEVPTVVATTVQTEAPTNSARSAAQAQQAPTEAPSGGGGGLGDSDTSDTDASANTEASTGADAAASTGGSTDVTPTEAPSIFGFQADEEGGDEAESSDTDAAVAAAPTVQPEPAQKAAGAAAGSEESAGGSAESSEESIAMSAAPAAEGSTEASPTPTASPTATATATATTTPAPSPTVEPTATAVASTEGTRNDDSDTGWRIAEIALAAVLALMVAALLFIGRFRTRF
jgi:hypothetical protein